MGNPSDMYGGRVVSITTQERAYCTIQENDRLEIIAGEKRATIQHDEDLRLTGDRLDILRATLLEAGVSPQTARFRIETRTDIPMRAGLAGSTAIVGAVVGALNSYFGWELNRYQLAEFCRKVEARRMNIMCGFQDQYMTIFGGVNFMQFAGKESLQQQPEEPFAVVEPLQWPNTPDTPDLVLAHTGIQHDSGTVHRSPRQRWEAGEEPFRRNYARIGELGWLARDAILKRQWEALGELMNENHRLVQELGGSGPQNDALIEAARKAGALGAKLAGAGGGGTVIVLTRDRGGMADALRRAGAEQLLAPAAAEGLAIKSIRE